MQAVERQASNNRPMRQLLSTLSTKILSEKDMKERAAGATTSENFETDTATGWIESAKGKA